LEDLVITSSSFGGAFYGRRVLVTGHTGFKGAWLSAWLLKLGAEVFGYSLGIPTQPSIFELCGLEERLKHELGDIRDRQRLGASVKSFRPDFVIHMAAQAIVSEAYVNPVETVSSNVLGTACVLDALRAVDWPCSVVIVASDKCYENREWPWGYRENDRMGGKDVYSASKGAAEIIFSSFYRSFFQQQGCSVRLATARAGNVIGGGDWAKDRIVPDCIRAWRTGEKVHLRSPASIRPWQHVMEPLSGYLALAEALSRHSAFNGESFNFGPIDEQNHTVLELLTDLARVWGFQDPSRGYDIMDEIPFHEATLLKLSCDKAARSLRWRPTLTYKEGMAMTGSWYRDVVRDSHDAWTATSNQIDAYEALAHGRDSSWRDGVPAPVS
jgi:CDP-glucose 4,6-dehydratase